MRYDFEHSVLGRLASPVFDRIANTLVDAFVARGRTRGRASAPATASPRHRRGAGRRRAAAPAPAPTLRAIEPPIQERTDHD